MDLENTETWNIDTSKSIITLFLCKITTQTLNVKNIKKNWIRDGVAYRYGLFNSFMFNPT